MDQFSQNAIKAAADREYFNTFAWQNKKFILASAYKAVGHFVTEQDDEWSVALLAFHEAVQGYDPVKGEFAAYANVVIRRRLVDESRRQEKYKAEIPVMPGVFTGAYTAEELSDAGKDKMAATLTNHPQLRSREVPGDNPVKDEIEAVQELLGNYGFSFFDLTSCSPHADKTKAVCAEAVKCLLKAPLLFEKMRKTKSLPIAELCTMTKASRKLLERHRRYIIAAAEILNGEYPLLAEYMSYIRKSLKT